MRPENSRDTYVTPITFDEETDIPISSYTVSPTPSRQPDIHLFTTYSPEPNEDTYENIQAGVERILEVYKNEAEDKASIIDIDPDFGEHNFNETHPTYDSLRYVITTYEYESTFEYLQDLFLKSPKIHAILNFAIIDDLDRFETEDKTEYDTVRVELNCYATLINGGILFVTPWDRTL